MTMVIKIFLWLGIYIGQFFINSSQNYTCTLGGSLQGVITRGKLMKMNSGMGG
jgi:hypothetical protein